MELKEPKCKQYTNPPQRHFLPIPLENDTGTPSHGVLKRFTGIFFGDSVAVFNPEHMAELYNKGFFGKGSLSHSEPCFEKVQPGVPPVIRERQWRRRCDWKKKTDDVKIQLEFSPQTIKKLPDSRKKCSNSLVSGNTHKFHEKKKNHRIVEVINLDSDNSFSAEEEPKKSSKGCNKNNKIKVTKQSEAVSHATNKIPAHIELVTLDSPSVLTIDSDEDIEVVNKEQNTQYDQVKQLDMHQSSDKDTSQKSQDKHENKIVDVEESGHDSVQENSTDNTDMQQPMNEITSGEQENLSDEQASVTKVTESSPTDSTLQQEINADTNKDSAIVNTENHCSQKELTKQSEVETARDEFCVTKSTSADMNSLKIVENTLVVVADSGSETENEYFNKLNPRLETKNDQIRESLNLTFEETFFLSYGLSCLQVLDLYGVPISLMSMWKSFVSSQPDFIQNYIAYHHFRSKGWVVKPGLKFGGDFLLYKDGPPVCHASYVVIVDVLNEKNGCRIKGLSKEPLKVGDVVNLIKLAETSGKEVLFCYVLWPEDLYDKSTVTPKLFRRFKVSIRPLKRWKPSEECEQLDGKGIEPVVEKE